MKPSLHNILYLTTAAALALGLAACADDGVAPVTIPAPGDVEIVPHASLAASRADLSGPQDGPGFPASTDRVFAVSAFLTSDADDSKYDGPKVLNATAPNATKPYFLNQPIRTDEAGAFHFNTQNGQRYFPEDGSHVYFYAFSPACAVQDAADNKKVSWTLDGRQDIMVATDLRGIRKAHGSDLDIEHQPQPNFHFSHLLTRLNFRCRRETGFADYMYISNISIGNQPTIATLDFNSYDTGNSLPELISYSKEIKALSYSLPTSIPVEVTIGYDDVASMLVPPADNYNIAIGFENGLSVEFIIKASDLRWDMDDPNHGAGDIDQSRFKPGCSYNVNMRFEGVRITFLSVEMSDWADGGSTNGIFTYDE